MARPFSRKQYTKHMSGFGTAGKARVSKKHHRVTNEIGSNRIPPGIRRQWRKK